MTIPQYCYAEVVAENRRGVKGDPYEQGFEPRVVPMMLTWPLEVEGGQHRMVFVDSMTDLFHANFSDDFILRVFEVMRVCNWKIFQVLTKRAERMAAMLNGVLRPYGELEHIWFGVSVEDREHGLPRADILREAPAKVRWLSVEPLLEDLGDLNLAGLHWVVVGGESGGHLLDPVVRAKRGLVTRENGLWLPHPEKVEWVQSIRDQCITAEVPFFFKQWGGSKSHIAGCVLDGRTWEEYPQIRWKKVPSQKERRRRKTWVSQSLIGSNPLKALPPFPSTLLDLLEVEDE